MTVRAALALACLLPAAAAAATPASERRAERVVGAELAGRGFTQARAVDCARTARVRSGATRLSCRWRARRPLSPHRSRACRGRYLVRLRKRGARLRRAGRTRCSLRVRAVDPWLGFNDNAIRGGQVSAVEDAALTEGIGAGLHRVTFDWRYVEPARDRYELEDYDRIYRAMLARGIRPLFILMFAPRWAWDPLTSCSGDCRLPPARAELGEWREIAALIATRYPRAAGVEVWNEPNNVAFWEPWPDAERYAEVLTEAYRAVKRANPAMRVATGGFADPRPRYGVGLRDFAAAVFEAGAASSFDALAFHLYPRDPSPAELVPTLATVRGLRDRFRPDRPPLWLTETGFTTTGPPAVRVGEPEQAASLAGLYRAIRREKDVQALLVHTLIDPGGDPESPEPGYGIVRGDGSRKPAYCALARAVRRLRTCP